MPSDMNRPATSGKIAATGPRHGPRTIAALLPAILRPAFRKHGAAGVQIMTDWAEIVGPSLSAVTQPRRFVAGSLTIACAGPVALELQHLSAQLIDRINGQVGRPLVQRIRFVQGMPPLPRPAIPSPTRRLPVPIPAFPDGPLRDALADLGAVVPPQRT